jgi:protein-S-isoprenylcysteine O-methyltransferase Ste14
MALQVFVGGRFLPEGWTWIQFAVGVPLIAVGLGLAAWTARTMFANGTSPNPMRDSTQLLSTGPFGFSRHPFFLGTILAFLGIAIAFNGAWLLIRLARGDGAPPGRSRGAAPGDAVR